jgi:predicted amidohydrolase YtcJ
MAGDNRPTRSMLVRVAAVGSVEEVRAAAVPDARAVPLDGATVTPG